jgi:hypothetical protein
VDNPNWGNNAEASSSTGVRNPRLEFIKDSELDNSDSSDIEFDSPLPESRDLVLYNQDFARKQIVISIHGWESSTEESLGNLVQDMDMRPQQITDHCSTTHLVPNTPSPAHSRRRRGRPQTPL